MPVEPETSAATATTEAPSEFNVALRAAMDRADAEPTEEIVDDPEETAEGGEQPEGGAAPAEPAAIVEPPKEDPKPAAPQISPGWISEAVRLNVPREVLRFARSDDEVREMIVSFGDQPEEESPATPAEFPLAGEEFDATDPVHRALKQMWEENQQLRGDLGKVTQSTTGLITERQREAILAEEAEFDAALDALNIPELGGRGSEARKAAWLPYKFFQQQGQGISKAELAKRAAFAGNPDLIVSQATQKQLEAIKDQEQATLGAGPSKPPAVKPPTAQDDFRAKLREANRRATKRLEAV